MRRRSPSRTSPSATPLWEQAASFARGLQNIGLERGQRVAIYLDKRIETVASVFGTSGVFVPVNPLLRPQQVTYILDDCAVRVLVTSAERYARLREHLAENTSVEQVIVVDAALAPDPEPGVAAWESFVADGDVFEPGAIDLDIAAIFYTSGSTGKPKGVVLSHRNLLVGGASVSQYLENDEKDCILAALPLSFDAGFSQLTTGFTAGAHVVLVNYLLPGDVVRPAPSTG